MEKDGGDGIYKEQLVGETLPPQNEPATEANSTTSAVEDWSTTAVLSRKTRTAEREKIRKKLNLEKTTFQRQFESPPRGRRTARVEIHESTELKGLRMRLGRLQMNHSSYKVPENSYFLTKDLAGKPTLMLDSIQKMFLQIWLDDSLVRLWALFQALKAVDLKNSLCALVDPFHFLTIKHGNKT